MSKWTHITACIYLDTNVERKFIKRYVEKILNKAPQITGSEGNANIFVNVPAGASVYYSDDKEYQTRVVITICGDLRDRTIQETEDEYEEFTDYIKEELPKSEIRQETYSIQIY